MLDNSWTFSRDSSTFSVPFPPFLFNDVRILRGYVLRGRGTAKEGVNMHYANTTDFSLELGDPEFFFLFSNFPFISILKESFFIDETELFPALSKKLGEEFRCDVRLIGWVRLLELFLNYSSENLCFKIKFYCLKTVH